MTRKKRTEPKLLRATTLAVVGRNVDGTYKIGFGDGVEAPHGTGPRAFRQLPADFDVRPLLEADEYAFDLTIETLVLGDSPTRAKLGRQHLREYVEQLASDAIAHCGALPGDECDQQRALFAEMERALVRLVACASDGAIRRALRPRQ